MKLEKLIERAAAIAGSEYKVAKALGIPPQQVCDWKAGRRTCGPEDRALLADVAGVDPMPEIAEALLERVASTREGVKLQSRVLIDRGYTRVTNQHATTIPANQSGLLRSPCHPSR